jgi:hypothetical protein
MQERSWYKKRWVWFSVCGFILFLMGWALGDNYATVAMGDQKATFDELVTSIDEKEITLEETKNVIEARKDELDGIQEVMKNNQDTIKKAEEFMNNKASLEQELTVLSNQINSKKSEIQTLVSTITSKQEELNSLTGKIQETGEAPIELSAGIYTVGVDLPAHRYKAEPIGDGSNFVVKNSDDRLVVNTILGSGGEPEYIFPTLDNYTIDTKSRVRLTRVE